MPQAVTWHKIYKIDPGSVGSVTQDVNLKAIHPDATLNDYTFLVKATYLNFANGGYELAIEQHFVVNVLAGTMTIGGYRTGSPERFGATSGEINMTASVVSDQLRFTITIDSGALACKGHLWVEVKGTPDPSP